MNAIRHFRDWAHRSGHHPEDLLTPCTNLYNLVRSRASIIPTMSPTTAAIRRFQNFLHSIWALPASGCLWTNWPLHLRAIVLVRIPVARWVAFAVPTNAYAFAEPPNIGAYFDSFEGDGIMASPDLAISGMSMT